MNQATYQSYLAAKQTHDATYKEVYNDVLRVAIQAGDMLAAHPDRERIAHWIEYAMGFDGSFDRYHVFQHTCDGQVARRWSQANDGSFVLTTQEMYGEREYHHYAIPAAWVFASLSERTKLIQAELDSIVADAKAHDAAKEAEQERADRAHYESLKARFRP